VPTSSPFQTIPPDAAQAPVASPKPNDDQQVESAPAEAPTSLHIRSKDSAATDTEVSFKIR
jgi:hypothetical protein